MPEVARVKSCLHDVKKLNWPSLDCSRDGNLVAFMPRETLYFEAGGARRDRTDDLLLAKQALSQLSYGPFWFPQKAPNKRALVGLGRFELPTSRLSGVRSNQLSYRPEKAVALRRQKRETKTAAFRSFCHVDMRENLHEPWLMFKRETENRNRTGRC